MINKNYLSTINCTLKNYYIYNIIEIIYNNNKQNLYLKALSESSYFIFFFKKKKNLNIK